MHNNKTPKTKDDHQSAAALGRRTSSGPPRCDDGEPDATNALRAYLQLKAVDPHADDVAQRCRDAYLGSYQCFEDVLMELTDLRDFQLALDDLVERWGLGPIVQLDPKQLETTARTLWHVVRLGQRFYVFGR